MAFEAPDAQAGRALPARVTRIGVVSLGVSDLDRAIAFYREALGFAPPERKGPVAYFALDGAWLALAPRRALAGYVGVPFESGGYRDTALGHNVSSRAEVDALMTQAARAGAEIVQPAAEAAWGGYTGWLADPDGHLWEIVWNPRPFLPAAP